MCVLAGGGEVGDGIGQLSLIRAHAGVLVEAVGDGSVNRGDGGYRCVPGIYWQRLDSQRAGVHAVDDNPQVLIGLGAGMDDKAMEFFTIVVSGGRTSIFKNLGIGILTGISNITMAARVIGSSVYGGWGGDGSTTGIIIHGKISVGGYGRFASQEDIVGIDIDGTIGAIVIADDGAISIIVSSSAIETMGIYGDIAHTSTGGSSDTVAIACG